MENRTPIPAQAEAAEAARTDIASPENPPGSANCAVCCALLSSLIVMAGAITFSVFTVVFLVRDQYVCPPLWNYVLICAIFGLISSRARANRRSHEETELSQSNKLFRSLFSPLFNVIYGSLVLYGGAECTLKKTGISVIAQIIYFGSIVGLICILMLLLILWRNPSTPVAQPATAATLRLGEFQAIIDALGAETQAQAHLPEAQAVRTGTIVTTAVNAPVDIELGDIVEARAVR